MTSLSARAVSLSDHVKRRRNNTSSSANNGSSGNEAFGASSGGGSSTSNSPLKTYVPQHHPMNTEYHPNTTTTTTTTHRPPPPPIGGGGSVGGNEGGYDSHVASYGNYDAPSLHCRSYHASEHGCYAVESHMGFIPRRSHNATSNSSSSSSNKAVVAAEATTTAGGNHPMARLGSYSNPLLDLEDQRYICSSSRQRRTTNTATLASSSPRSGSLDQTPELLGGRRRRLICQEDNNDSSSFCSNALTASTASSSGSSSNNSNSNSSYSHHSMDASCCASSSSSAASIAPPTLDEDAIRQGILDFSTLVATYLAGALSFLIGIFLTLLSPLIKIIKCIVGDVRGLLGDAGFLHELGSLWRLYRDLRRSSERSSSQDPHHHPYSSNTTGGDYHYYNHQHHPSSRYHHHQDDTSLEDGSTTVCSAETSTQFVGGWRPHVCPSVGSGCGASSVNTPSINMGGGTVRSSSSSSSWGAGGGVVAMNASPRPSQHVSSSLSLGQDSGIRPGAGDGHSISTTTSKKNDEVSSCPPQMTWHQQSAPSCSESRPYCNPSSRGSSGNHAYARRSTDLSNHQSPSFPPRTTTMQQQYGCPSYPQAPPPQNRYPRSKSDVVS